MTVKPASYLHAQAAGTHTAQPPDTYEWQLPGRSHATPREARRLVIEACRYRGISARTMDDVAVTVSELTTNAVLHAPSDTAKVSVTLTYWAVHVVVTDRGPSERET